MLSPFQCLLLYKNRKMKIGILREEKVPVDRRVPFSPSQCKKIEDNFPNLQIYVQSSNIRCFSDQEYIDHGITVLDNIESCDVLFGIKEVPKDKLISNKTYFFFRPYVNNPL